MGHIRILLISICFSSLGRIALCRKESVFAFTGCNVTLNWNLGNKSSNLEKTIGWIVDTAGNLVLQATEDTCSTRKNDSSMECTVSNQDSQLIISLVIMNIMTNNSGNYTMCYKKGMVLQNMTKELVILENPHITANGKPVLLESFTVTCNTSYISDCQTFYWKRRGIHLNYTSQLRADSSKLIFTNLTEIDILNNLTCEVKIKDCANIECKDCYDCSEESEPLNVIPFSSSNLDPTNKNRFLQQDSNDSPFQLLGVGLTIAAFCMIIIGILICVTQMRKYASRRQGTKQVHEVIHGPTNRVAREMLNVESHNRSLRVPTVQDNACWITRRSGCPNVNRKSISLQTLMDHTHDNWNQFRQSMSFQTMLHLLHAIKWQANAGDPQIKTLCSLTDRLKSMEGSTNGIRPEELYSRIGKDNNISCKAQNSRARSLSLHNFRPASFDQTPNEEQYSTIDEARLSLYHGIKVHNTDENLQEDHINNEAGNNDYDYATLPAL